MEWNRKGLFNVLFVLNSDVISTSTTENGYKILFAVESFTIKQENGRTRNSILFFAFILLIEIYADNLIEIKMDGICCLIIENDNENNRLISVINQKTLQLLLGYTRRPCCCFHSNSQLTRYKLYSFLCYFQFIIRKLVVC